MAQPKPDYDSSVEFLEWFRPGGPWTLTAIGLDKRSISTESLSSSANVLSWLKKHGGSKNIYFMVNPPLRPLSKKAEKEDVASVSWLHLDVDPRAGEDLQEERDRALKLLTEPPGGIPKPSCVVFSGGGYQGFWRLDDPINVDGRRDLAEEAERFNLQLEIEFGADHCHNVDRIMRLPGTLNRPDERKKAKGRTLTLATVEWVNDEAHPVSAFTAAPKVQDSINYGEPVQVSGNVARLNTVDDLPKSVPDLLKVVIVQGSDPDDPHKWPSRSEALFWVCCELVRNDVSDEIIYSVITDPAFGISSSVLEMGSGSDRYARKQIKTAKEEAISPELRELNEKHAVIADVGGKCRVLCEVPEERGGARTVRISYQTFADFCHRYENRSMLFNSNGKTTEMPLGVWWRKHSKRRQYETVVFAPGQEVPGAYNLWNGFAYDGRPGDCGLLLKHVRDNICKGEEDLYNYLIGWMAAAVQRPHTPGHTAVVLRGRKGTGKSFAATAFGSLFGRHFLHISDSKHLVGSFNAHLRDCVVLLADEAFYAGDKRHESMLKTLVTEERIALEAKGVDVEVTNNCVHLIMASDSQWVVPAGVDERRFLVLDVGDDHMRDLQYFQKIKAQLDNGGYEGFLHMLMTMDLSEYDPRNVPGTAGLQDQKIRSFNAEEEWWYKKLCDGQIVEGEDWPDRVICSSLLADFTESCRTWSQGNHGNATKLGLFLTNCLPDGAVRVRMAGTHLVPVNGVARSVVRPTAYKVPSLEKCRELWDERYGGPYDWPSELEVVEVEQQEVPF